jgi:hypothetical protein
MILRVRTLCVLFILMIFIDDFHFQDLRRIF